MRAFLPLLSLSAVAQALYFYVEGNTPKCFFEELPHDTLVVGHYTAEEYDEQRGGWFTHDKLSVYISVDVCRPLFIHSFLFHFFFTRDGSMLTTSRVGDIRQ